jgi:hypothetical protein
VRPRGVVVVPPCFDDGLGSSDAREPVFVETLVPELAIEASQSPRAPRACTNVRRYDGAAPARAISPPRRTQGDEATRASSGWSSASAAGVLPIRSRRAPTPEPIQPVPFRSSSAATLASSHPRTGRYGTGANPDSVCDDLNERPRAARTTAYMSAMGTPIARQVSRVQVSADPELVCGRWSKERPVSYGGSFGETR